MATKIIVLEIDNARGGEIGVNCLFWLPVTPGKEVVLASSGSSYPKAAPAELNAIAAGQVIEEQHQYSFPASATAAQIQNQLATFFNDRLTWITAQVSKGNFWGFAWDGTAWAKLP